MLTGLILAGGRSSRMGRDKAHLTLPDGRTLLERQIELVREAGVTQVLVSVGHESEIMLAGVTMVSDQRPDAGPLEGIASGLRSAASGQVLVLAVDMPGVRGEHLRELLAHATVECGVVPVRGSHCEPLAAVYPAVLADSAEQALVSGRRAVHQWVRAEADRGRLRLWKVPAGWGGVLQSWNTAADMAHYPVD